MRLLTTDQARQLEYSAIHDCKIPLKTLMERAGIHIAKQAMVMIKGIIKPQILIICGKGNNGGDAFAAAFELNKKKYSVHIYSFFLSDDITDESSRFFNKCKKHKISITFGYNLPKIKNPSLIIDGILGIGFKGNLKENIVPWIDYVNQSQSKVLSIDIPSGLNGDSGKPEPLAIKADATTTFGAVKIGMTFRQGPEFCGKIVLCDIGLPKLNKIKFNGLNWNFYSQKNIKRIIHRPKIDAHKYSSGKVLIISGSQGMVGSAILATYGALRSGAGLTMTTAPSSLNLIYGSKIIEGLIFILEDNNDGFLNESHYEIIMKKVDWADSVLIGPGMGRNDSTIRLIRKLVKTIQKPIVLDADGLFPFAGRINDLNQCKTSLVITPHIGEFSYLINKDKDLVISKFSEIISEKAKTFSHTMLIKQVPSCLISNNNAMINISGNQAMATAGTGDVLSGLIAGLIAQGLSTFDASALGSFFHGKASDELVIEKGFRGQIASDILEKIPSVIKLYEQS